MRFLSTHHPLSSAPRVQPRQQLWQHWIAEGMLLALLLRRGQALASQSSLVSRRCCGRVFHSPSNSLHRTWGHSKRPLERWSRTLSAASAQPQEDTEDIFQVQEEEFDGDQTLFVKSQIPTFVENNHVNNHHLNCFEVTAPFPPRGDQPKAIEELLQQIEAGNRFSILRGITGTGKTLVMAHVIANWGKPTLVLCHNKTLAAQLARELRSFLGKNAVELFVSYYNHYVPESFNEVTSTYTTKKSSINQDIDAMRHRATRALLTRQDVVVVASVSCIYGLGLPKEYLEASTTLNVGGVIEESPKRFLETLDGMLYQHEPEDDDFGRGAYQVTMMDSQQWDIMLWPPHESFPMKVELQQQQDRNDWVIQSIQQGHAGGHTPISSFCIFPAKHHVMSEDRLADACLDIEEELTERVKELTNEGKYEESSRLQQRVMNDLLMLRETGFVSGAENYSRHFARRQPGQAPDTLMDYLNLHNRDWLLLIDESHVTIPQLKAMYGGDRARKERLVKHGYRLPSALDNRPLKDTEFWERVKQCVFVSATPSAKELDWAPQKAVDMIVRPTFVCDPVIDVKPSHGQLEDLVEEVKIRGQQRERTLAVTLTKRDAEDLASFLSEQGVNSTYIHSGLTTHERAEALKALQSGEVDCLVGVNLLREGLDLPQVSLVAILNADSEGFLRSETALLQMVGRAARNVSGKALMYANRITQSMQKCIDDTNRRREIQLNYNKEFGCEMVSTKGSSIKTIFELAKDQIDDERPLEVVGGRRTVPSTAVAVESESIRPDVTVQVPVLIDESSCLSEIVNTDHVPSSPGVYFWKDGGGNILYIGKAKKLRSRVKSYLAPGAKHSARINVMMKKARSIDFILTKSERDALVLESNSIKHFFPPYNVLLKDDESYPYICASVGDPFPRFFAAPRRQEGTHASGYRYFGPYTDFNEINTILTGLEERYDLRSNSFKARHGSGSKEEYNKLFQQALDENFSATGNNGSTLVKQRMEFEEAALLFDSAINLSRDVVAFAPIPGHETAALVYVVKLRNGLVAGRYSYHCEMPSGFGEDDYADAIQTVLERRHYPSGEESADSQSSFFPNEVLIQYLPSNTKELKQVIRTARRRVEPDVVAKPVVIKVAAFRGPKKEADSRAMEFATANAEQAAYEKSLESVRAPKTSVDGTALRELAALLNLEKEPTRIECYDISHNQGDFPVGSRVVFTDGKPARNLYRKFNIKTVDGIDDYASLEETLARRFRRAWVNGEGPVVDDDDAWSLPDLVVIDGGPGQLGAAVRGMAKARVFPVVQSEAENGPKTVESTGRASSTAGATRSATVAVCSLAKNQEELFLYGANLPVNDTPDSPALLLLRALRDESHRFALNAHRKRRSVRSSS